MPQCLGYKNKERKGLHMFNLEALFLMEYSSVNNWLNLCLWIQSPACILALVFVLTAWYCFQCTVKCNTECAPSTLFSTRVHILHIFFLHRKKYITFEFKKIFKFKM